MSWAMTYRFATPVPTASVTRPAIVPNSVESSASRSTALPAATSTRSAPVKSALSSFHSTAQIPGAGRKRTL